MSLPATLTADILLVDRCIQGSEAANRELFRSYQQKIRCTLFRILGNTSELDDLIQESFIQVFRALPRYRAEARLATWIDRITVRVAYKHMRARKKIPLPVEDFGNLLVVDSSDSSQLHRQVISRQGVRHLYEALATLPIDSRIAFALHEIDGRSVEEVAHLVDASKAATKLRIWRARRRLFALAKENPILAEVLQEDSR